MKLVNRWRDRQIAGFGESKTNPTILKQENAMLDFTKSCENSVWAWYGDDTKFRDICQKQITLDNTNHNGVIIFGKELESLSTRELSEKISSLIKDVKYAYVGINRYLISRHDLEYTLPDDLGESIDLIISKCDTRFKRIYRPSGNAGAEMVYSHPLDCFCLCK